MSANGVPVTLGNVVGGGILVAGIYWFLYLRRGSAAESVDRKAPNPGGSGSMGH